MAKKQQPKTVTDAAGNRLVPDPADPERFVLVAADDEPNAALASYLGLPVEEEQEE